jgi:hypothetical protein
MKMTDFWVVAPCSLIEVYRRFRGACCLHYTGDSSLSTNSFLDLIIIIIIKPNEAVERLAYLLRIREIPGTNLGPEIGYSD